MDSRRICNSLPGIKGEKSKKWFFVKYQLPNVYLRKNFFALTSLHVPWVPEGFCRSEAAIVSGARTRSWGERILPRYRSRPLIIAALLRKKIRY